MGILDDPGHRDVTFEQMVANYRTQIQALVEGGVDLLLPETSFDTLVLKACLFAIDSYFAETGTAAAGDGLGDDLRQSSDPLGPAGRGVLLLGLPLRRPQRGAQLRGGGRADARALESLAAICRTRVSCYPNAGMPDGFGGFLGDKDETARLLGEFARSGWLNIVGGCCGTTPEWIAGHRQGRRRRAAPAGPRPAALVELQRHGAAGHPPRDQLHHDRRADQHHRLEASSPA